MNWLSCLANLLRAGHWDLPFFCLTSPTCLTYHLYNLSDKFDLLDYINKEAARRSGFLVFYGFMTGLYRKAIRPIPYYLY